MSRAGLIFPFQFDNKMKAKVYGIEVAADWRWLDWWRWRFSYSHLRMNLKRKPGSNDTFTVPSTEGSSPQNQVALTSFVDLPGNWSWMGSFVTWTIFQAKTSADILTWTCGSAGTPTKNVELSLVGQNLLHGHHAEWGGGTEIQRGIYTKATWRW